MNDRKMSPVSWPRVPLESVAAITDGDWILTSDYAPTGVRLLQVGDIGCGRFIGKSSRFISESRAQELHCTLLRSGDVLISRMPDPIGRACLLPDLGYPCITAVDVSIVRARPEEVDSHYLVHLFSSKSWFELVAAEASGATRARISRSNLQKLLIPIPSLPDQQRIAAKLDEQMATLAKAQAALAAQREAATALRSAVLRTALDPATHPDWQFSKVGNVCDVVNGVGFPEYMQGRKDLPYPFVKVSDMNADGAEVIVSSARNTVDDAILATLGGHAYPMGTVIFPKVGGALLTNKKRILGQPSCFDNNVMGLVPHGVDSRFLYMWFKSVDLRTLSNTQALPSVRQSVVAALEMPLPSRAEQRRIAKHLNDSMKQLDAVVVSLDCQASTLDALCTSLLDAAFSGQA